MERALGAGQDHRHRGWVLQDEPAEQEPGREQGAWAGVQKGEVAEELREGGAPGVRLWAAT